MRRPSMSTGAWVFATAVTVAAITAPAVYAAATSTVAIGNRSNAQTALVTTNGQLLTTLVAPKQVVSFQRNVGGGSAACISLYKPPQGKALVITSVTYSVYNGMEGSPSFFTLWDANCATKAYDNLYTLHGTDTQVHSFVGLPVPSLGIYTNGPDAVVINVVGYLIPASQLP